MIESILRLRVLPLTRFITQIDLLFQRFATSLHKFDVKLARTSPTLAYLRTALRDHSCDRYIDKTKVQIVTAESKDLKSPNHASEVCSVLAAYRLVDVIHALEKPDDWVKAPHHERLEVDMSGYKVSP